MNVDIVKGILAGSRFEIVTGSACGRLMRADSDPARPPEVLVGTGALAGYAASS